MVAGHTRSRPRAVPLRRVHGRSVEHELLDAAARAGPAFVLVAGLLVVGGIAADDGLFARAGGAVGARSGAHPLRLLGGAMIVVALTTAVLNLDTAVAFCTPVLVAAARRAGVDETPCLYGTLFMANGASLLLPGANLTNIILREASSRPGGALAALPVALVAAIATGIALAVVFRDRLRASAGPTPSAGGCATDPARGDRLVSALLVVAVGVAVVAVPEPAPAVAALAAVAVALRIARRRSVAPARQAWAAAGPRSLTALFAVSVLAGVAGASWTGPARLVEELPSALQTVAAALLSVAVNNLPASSLLAAHAPADPTALLIGLDLGPNLAVTGSLSALLWFRAACAAGARPGLGMLTRRGVPIGAIGILAAIGAHALR